MVDQETTAWDRQDAKALGRACKGYSRIGDRWLLIFHTGLLDCDGQ